jgi:hypothetical protein
MHAFLTVRKLKPGTFTPYIESTGADGVYEVVEEITPA